MTEMILSEAGQKGAQIQPVGHLKTETEEAAVSEAECLNVRESQIGCREIEEDDLTIPEVERVLDEKVRPVLAEHGGNIRVESLLGNHLRVKMEGQCHNCPSAELTLEQTVNTALKEAFPQLSEISLVTGVSDSLIAEMKMRLQMRRQGA